MKSSEFSPLCMLEIVSVVSSRLGKGGHPYRGNRRNGAPSLAAIKLY